MRLLPSRVEVAVFALMAVACTVVVVLLQGNDYALLIASVPLVTVTLAMGGRRRALARSRAR